MNRIRLLSFIITIVLLAASVLSYVFFDNNFLIRKWNIPLSPPGFLDARQMAWAAESYAQGYDPLVENPVNWRGHQLNYPRIWQLIFALKIDRSHTNVIGVISVIIFFIGVGFFWFSKQYDNFTYCILTVAALSSVVMLALERANIELIIFCIISLALAVNYYYRTPALCLFLLASVLKIYPVFGFIYLLKEEKKKFWSLFLLLVAIFTAYVLFTLIDTMRVYDTTPQLPGSSMGMHVWWLGLNNRRFFDLHLSSNVILVLKILSYTSVTLITATTLYLGLKGRNADQFRQGKYLDSFRVGAAIYIGCFIVIINADYRLLFLLFTIPQVISWMRSRETGLSIIPLVILSAILVSLWNSFIMRFLGRNPTFLIEEFCNWVIFTGFLYLLFSSLPEWFRDYFGGPFSRKPSPGQIAS